MEEEVTFFDDIRLSRRDFLIISAANLIMIGCYSETNASDIDRNTKPETGRDMLPSGIYAVTNTANWVLSEGKRKNLFEVDFVDGVTSYIRWSDIEKEEGEYDWKALDRMMKEAADNNKKLSCSILSGNHAPDWLYKKAGVSGYEYFMPLTSRKSRTFLPWVKSGEKRLLNTGVLEVWEKTVSSFADYIRNHPLKERIAYVAITGGPTSNGLEIMWAGRRYGDFRRLNWNAEAESLFIQFWMKVIDIFIKYLPDIPLGLAFTDLFGVNFFGMSKRDIEVSETIVNHASKSAGLHNAAVIPMGLWLGNIDPDDLKEHNLIKLLLSFNTPFALQGGLRTSNKKKLEKMLSFAVEIKTSWIELWHDDILNKDYVRIIRDARDKMRI